MKISSRFSQIITIIIALVVSVILFLLAYNYSVQFWVSYVFFLLGGAGAFLAINNYSRQNRNSFPISMAFIVIAYLYWLLTATVAFGVGITFKLPWNLFLLIELLTLGLAVLLVFLFQSVSTKYETEDENVRIRNIEINEITQRITAIYEKSTGLNKLLNYQVGQKISVLKEAFRYSEVLSPYYTIDMLQPIYDGLTVIENELNIALLVQSDEVSRLENAISNLVVTIKNNDEVCKASKH